MERQAEFLEKPGEYGKHADGPGVGSAAAVEDETGVHVLDGEGIAECPVTGGELPLEVRRPGIIGLGSETVRPAWMPTSETLTTFGNQVVAQEDVVDRSSRRQVKLWPMTLEIPDDLLGPVVVVGTPDLEDGLDQVGWSGPGGAPGPRGVVLEAGRAIPFPAFEPLVACGPTDSVVAADGAEALHAVMRLDYKASTFVHDMDLLERHRSPPVRCRV